uniref:Uncharacterized protein n=1 Tax=Astyanax mexicanus TaxID=7994 RepID=A0A8B9KZ25_ASTMX
MEPWPIVAWVLTLTFIADWLQTVQSRDFTEKDIIFLHPSSKYLYQYLKPVFNITDTLPLPHTLFTGAVSHSLHPRCLSLTHTDLYCPCFVQVCVACCEGNICNLPLPRNETDAIFATTSPLSGGQRTTLHPTMPLSFLISTLLVLSQG